jgi:hypothetical protein
MSSFDLPSLMAALREHPVPLAQMITLRDTVAAQSGAANFLFGACRDPEADGSTLADPELAQALSGVELGRWPMGVAAIDAWASAVLARRPDTVLEFGSGVSTVVSALLMRRIHGDEGVRVYSVEQGEEAGVDTYARLEALGLQGLVSMHIAPVTEGVVDVFESAGYGVTAAEMGIFLGEARPQMVLVDGPFGGYGARFSTLPVAHPWLANDAEIWMDDALRDSELAIAYWWSELGYFQDAQLQFVAKGIVRGVCGPDPAVYADAAAALAVGELTGPVAEYILFKMRVQAAFANTAGLQPPFQTT